MIMATSIYTCGPAALATIMKNMGVYTTEAELAQLAGTDNTGTSLYGLKTAAESKGLNAVGATLPIDQLKTNYLVVLSINGINHFQIVLNITDTTVYLFDPNLGNIEMTLEKFNELYTGYVLVVSNGTIQLNGTLLTDYEMQNIKALAYKVKKTTTKSYIPGYYYPVGREWIDTSYSVPRISLVYVPGYWRSWGPISWYVFPRVEIRVKWIKVNRGYWKTIYKYKPGQWVKKTSFEGVYRLNPKRVYVAVESIGKIATGAGIFTYGILLSPFDDSGPALIAMASGGWFIFDGFKLILSNNDPSWLPVYA
ncbi:MAG: hypothetical protein KKF16_05305 [Euryarchaeota archaeon]|nr:hypothetical protein [Euryarchaeota archaeon]MBV1756189.1 hypothetical protein [Methanobacterium sp.]